MCATVRPLLRLPVVAALLYLAQAGASPAPAEVARRGDGLGLDLALPAELAFDRHGRAADAPSAPLGTVLGLEAPPPALRFEPPAVSHLDLGPAALPFALDGAEAVLGVAGWRLRLGRGATSSRWAGHADLSPTRAVSGVPVGAHGPNVHLRPDFTGPTVGALFAGFDGLGDRRRARLDVDLADTSLAASFDTTGGADATIAHAGRWRGFETEARAALLSERGAPGRSLRLESSAALRDPASGWSVNLAAMGAHEPAGGGAPASLYAKVAGAADRDGPITTAWSVEAAHGRDIAQAGDRAWLAGATLLQRFQGLGRFHVHYRYQRLDGAPGREGRAHAVTLRLRLDL